jgi:hypothetical protein
MMEVDVESTNFLTINVIRHHLTVPVLNKEKQVAIWMHRGHTVINISYIVHLPKQLQIAYPALEDPFLGIQVLKNPD